MKFPIELITASGLRCPTALADGVLHPAKDTVKLNDGTERQHYYHVVPGVKHYRPREFKVERLGAAKLEFTRAKLR